MFRFGTRTCALCGSTVAAKRTLRAPDRTNGFVCSDCVDRWQRAGRRCGECQQAVRSLEDLGVFFERGALGHADCGGVRLFAA